MISAAGGPGAARLRSLRGQLGVVTLTVFFSSLAFDLYNGTLPIYLFRYQGYGLDLVSLLVGVASATQLLGALAAGPFIDSRGARLALRVGPLLYLPAAAIFVVSHDPLQLGLARVLQAAAFVLVLPAAYSLLPGMVSMRRRATGLAVVGVANTIALGLGSPLGLWLLSRSPQALFAASAASAGLALAVGSLLVVGGPAGKGSAVFRLRPSWLPFLAALFGGFVNWGLLLAFLPLQLPEARIGDVGWFFAADALALTVLRIPAGYATDRWGGRAMALAGLAFNLVALAILLQSRSLTALVAAGGGTGAAAALLLPAIQLELSLRSAASERGTAMALVSASFALAVSVGTLAGAALIARLGFAGAIWVVAIACAAATAPILLAKGVARVEVPSPAPTPTFAGMTPIEARVATIWVEVLGLGEIGLEEHFLDVGGESLQAIQIASHLSEAFDVEVPLVHVFENPTVAASALAIQALVAQPERHQAPHVVAAPAGDRSRASCAQERIWFLDQLDPGTPAYNVPFGLRFTGDLNVDALGRSLERLVSRQESLRTHLESSGEEVVQVVTAPRPYRLELTDLRDRPPAEREQVAARILEADARQPFDLTRGPLHRARLLQLSDAEHVLMLNLHHSIGDEWSRRVLVRELARGYVEDDVETSQKSGREPGQEPDPPRIRYSDFAAWQREQMLGDRGREELDYWTAELAGAASALALPTDRPRPAERSYRGGTVSISLPSDVVEAVRELSRFNDATLFMTLLAVFAVLLQRHSGDGVDDLLVGSPVANRTLAETEDLVGCFVNTLVLRVRLEGDPSFETLLERVRQTCLGAYSHSELPFERLVEHLQPSRDIGRTPLFQVMFDMEAPPPITGFPDELGVAPVTPGTGTAMFDLSLTMSERSDGMTATFEYSLDLFEASTVERIAHRFRRLLDSVIEDPGRRLSELELLPVQERGRLIELSTGPARQAGPLVFRRVEAHAARTPEATAVSYGDQRLSFAELNRRANQLARHLIGCGAGPGRLVGICLDRSPEFVTSVLAVHKAAAAYVPLDPSHPSARLSAVLDATGPAAVVTESRLLDRLPASLAPVVCIDQDWATIGQLAASDLAFEPAGSDLAYVIHTSGSTGRPKGVMISQSALGNWADASERTYGLRPDDRVLQFHSIGFDASVGDVFCTLAAGAELVIVPDPLRLSPEAMLEELPRLRPTVADFPTAYWHELVDELEGRPALPVGLRLIVIGGESALPEKMRRWQRYVDPRIRLANTYGPTESTVVATAWWLHAGFADRPMATVPIGRPVANVQAFVVDAELRACPIGVPGEVLLGGAQLAAGYLGLPDETERRFLIADPLGSGRPQRLYRTGDRARWLPSGDLEFLGRVDRQVKIRGVRVEPEEIEAALTTHPAVADAIVEARERTPGDIQLVGYVVFRPYLQVSPADLHRHLAMRLPAQVIPSAFVALERLPLTSAGKVDRRALPEPAPQAAGRRAQDVAASPLEQKIAGVWADVLGLASVAPTDNFFELGGHSLLAARLVSRLQRDLEVDLPVKAIFEAPTVEGLASRIEGALRGESAVERQRLERG